MVKTLRELKNEARNTYMKDAIDVDKSGKVRCGYCSKEINFTSKHGKDNIEKHVESEMHRRMKLNGNKQQSITESIEASTIKTSEDSSFKLRLTQAFVAANIPIFKLNNPI